MVSLRFAFCVIGLALLLANQGVGVEVATKNFRSDKVVSNAVEFLRSSQAKDGSYSAANGPGITALVTTAILRHGRSINDPMVAKSLTYLEEFLQSDGGIHQKGTAYRNYETCLAIMCFSEANQDGRYDKLLGKAHSFVKGIQFDEGEKRDLPDMFYGGAGYGKHRRPDLSNTNFLIDALKAGGASEDDEALQRALVFVSRCQNLETEHNTTPHSARNQDGGFYYTCANDGESQAGQTANGGLRSYGSMTYAGLKSMIYCGVDQDDPRVKAGVRWISKHYDLKSNPGMGQSGLFYYYHTFAKALDAIGKDSLTDANGNEHDWRAELKQELASRQRDNGSWLNEQDRWLEGDPNLVTGYALLSLSYCREN